MREQQPVSTAVGGVLDKLQIPPERIRTELRGRSVVMDSWRRSTAAGLNPSAMPVFHRVSEDEIARRRAANADLLTAAVPHLEWLSDLLANVTHVAYVTDADGIVLESRGDTACQSTFGLLPGFDWSESRMGTNGAGTALACGESVAVVGPEHFLFAFENCTCTAAPIRDGSGNIVGAIDVSTGVAHGSSERVLLVAYVAQMIGRDIEGQKELRQIGSLRDLSDRLNQRQLALEATNERLALLSDNVPCLVYVVDAAGRMLNVNKPWQELTGLPLSEIVGCSLYDLFDKATADQFAANNRRVLQEGAAEFEESYQGRTYLSLKVPVRDKDGVAYAICGFSTDITERKHVEAELEASRSALTDLDRRKDLFLAMLSHELRNPLGPINNGLQYLRARLQGDSQLRQVCELVNRNVEVINRLAGDLLDVSRVVHGKLELRMVEVDLREVTRHATETVQGVIAERKQRLTFSVPEKSVRVRGDALRLTQVLTNLLHNASKFTPNAGAIEVSVAAGVDEAEVKVSDNGVGMTPETLRVVFEPFVQAHRAGEKGGLGLGLCLSRQLVALHGGTITAWSEGPRTGSTFTVRLPLDR
jgi:PAS domain S-box-containing protein